MNNLVAFNLIFFYKTFIVVPTADIFGRNRRKLKLRKMKNMTSIHHNIDNMS